MYVHIPQYTVEHGEPSKYLNSTLYICKDHMYTVDSIKNFFEIKTFRKDFSTFLIKTYSLKGTLVYRASSSLFL